ncbi:MAG: hypothetical protein SFU99_03825 [Saprospiraceae bacterium]|nr:hypothetical protein [Saprospiraceae bacterium]
MSINEVNIHFQYSICDHRRFTDESVNIKPLPDWKAPLENRHHMHYFGTMKKRNKKVPSLFKDERFFISGRGGLKFEKLEGTNLFKARCLYRKLYSDGLCANRYEIGLSLNGLKKNIKDYPENEYQHSRLIHELLFHIPIKIKYLKKYENNIFDILNASKAIALLYQRATSELPSEDRLYNIKYGNLCIVLEVDKQNKAIKDILFDDVIEVNNSFSVYVKKYRTRGMEVVVFTLFGEIAENLNECREIRISLLRMFHEYQNMRLLLQVAQNPKNNILHEEFDKYLMHKLRFFKKVLSPNDAFQHLFNCMFSIFEIISPGEIDELSHNIERIRLQIKNKLLDFVKNNNVKNSIRFSENFKYVQQALAASDLKKAINLIHGIVDQKTYIIIQSRFNRLLLDEKHGVIGRNELEIEKNKLVLSILTSIDDYKLS